MNRARMLQWLFIAAFLLIGTGGYFWYQSKAGVKTSVTPVPSEMSTSGLVGYWTFDGADYSSATVITDKSGNSHSGTLTNSPTKTTGKWGQALDFPGSNQYVSVGSVYNGVKTVSFWIWADNTTKNIIDLNATATIDVSSGTVRGNNFTSPTIYIDGIASSTPTIDTEGWHFVAITTGTGINASAVDIGRVSTGYFDGRLDDVRMYSSALSASAVYQLYTAGTAKVNTPLDDPLSQSLRGYWKLDDGSGATVTDSSGNGNNTTRGNATCSSSSGSAAYRSSSATTYATRTNTTLTAPSGIQDGDLLVIIFDIGAASPPTPTPPSGFSALPSFSSPISMTAGGFTVNMYAWYKFASSESGNYTVTHSSASSQGYIVAISGADPTTPFYPNPTTNTGTGTTTTANSLTTSANNSLVMFISSDWGSTANNLTGPSGTTPTFTKRMGSTSQSGILYVADGVLGTAGATGNKTITNNSAGGEPFGGVLISVGPTCSSFNYSPASSTGQIGPYSLDFNGSTDYLSVADPSSGVLDFADGASFTLTGWFNRDTFANDHTILSTKSGQSTESDGYIAYIDDATDQLIIRFDENGSTDARTFTSTSTFTATGWHNFALSWNESAPDAVLYIDGKVDGSGSGTAFASMGDLSNTNAFYIGAETDAGNPFDGKLDDIRIYGYALSAEQVKKLYNITAPTQPVDTSLVGHWTFDGTDIQGTTAIDRSSFGNNGTMTGTTKTIGKLGQALSFNGSSDYVDIGTMDSTQGNSVLSVSVWIYQSVLSGGAIISNADGASPLWYIATDDFWGGNDDMMTLIESSSTDAFGYTTSSAHSAGVWEHWVSVFDGTLSGNSNRLKLYKNGIQQSLTFVSTVPATTKNGGGTVHANIGGYYNSANWNGNIDDVRIYNRALSSTEVLNLYNVGR